MAKVKVAGLNKAEGKRTFDPLINGDYLLQVNEAPKIVPSKKGNGDNWRFKYTVLDGPFQDEDETVAPDGRIVFDNVFIMDESHPSFEQWGHLGTEHLKEICNAFGVSVTASDNIEPSEFVGQTAWGVVRTEIPEDENGKKGEPRNVIRKYYSEEEK